MTLQQGWMEQRKHERVSTSLKVAYRVLEEKEGNDALSHQHYRETKAEHLPQLASKFHVYHAVTKDISEGGLSLTGDNPFVMGTHVEIIMTLPQYNKPLTLLSEVVRAGEHFQSGKTVYNAGVKLLALNREDVKRLSNFILAEKLRQPRQGSG
jgi:c-di-GMP-binding flagellar brake protein YcgR